MSLLATTIHILFSFLSLKSIFFTDSQVSQEVDLRGVDREVGKVAQEQQMILTYMMMEMMTCTVRTACTFPFVFFGKVAF